MSSPSSPPSPLSPPTRDTRSFPQARARETHASLLRAAAEVFADKGFDLAQTPDIAQAAGVSVGTFYRYFADKRQAFIELIRAHLADSFDSIMGSLTLERFGETRTPGDRRAAIDQVIDVLFNSVDNDPKLHHVFMSLSLRDPEVAAIHTEFEEKGRVILAQLLEQVTSRERIPDPMAAAEVIQVAAQEVAFANIGSRGPARSREQARGLRRALTDMIYRYVFGDT